METAYNKDQRIVEMKKFVKEFIELSAKYRCTISFNSMIDFDNEIRHGNTQEIIDQKMKEMEDFLMEDTKAAVEDYNLEG